MKKTKHKNKEISPSISESLYLISQPKVIKKLKMAKKKIHLKCKYIIPKNLGNFIAFFKPSYHLDRGPKHKCLHLHKIELLLY